MGKLVLSKNFWKLFGKLSNPQFLQIIWSLQDGFDQLQWWVPLQYRSFPNSNFLLTPASKNTHVLVIKNCSISRLVVDFRVAKKIPGTLKRTASLHLQMDGWNTIVSVWGLAYVQVLYVGFMECTWHGGCWKNPEIKVVVVSEGHFICINSGMNFGAKKNTKNSTCLGDPKNTCKCTNWVVKKTSICPYFVPDKWVKNPIKKKT